MKKIGLLILFYCLVHIVASQNVVSEIVTVDSSISKSTLYSNGLAWFAYQFKSSNDVVQMKDFDSGRIIGKGIFDRINQNGKTLPRHILITLTVKDGKYRYEMELEIVREYQITLEAKALNCGKTYATVYYNNGKLVIANIKTCKGKYLYDDQNVSWIERSNYKKWREKVNAELPELRKRVEAEIKEQVNEQYKEDAKKMAVFIDSLKQEMLKETDNF